MQLPEPAELTRSFESKRGKLPMPVDGEAAVVSGFGRRTHTEYARVEVQNNGIDIEGHPGAHARAVHSGTVSMVILMDGFQNVVLVRHGEYLTVYAGLATLDVRKGDNVTAGQSLGTLYTPPGDSHGTRLHFEVRHEKEKLDPAAWLKTTR
ncbi:MAG: peptidoglycan DD-metalloendopeptidase family protein [Roseburia sp.]|nr:peptidoglycan DD-metalloendopeptidase family protein [Roseburia sp.]